MKRKNIVTLLTAACAVSVWTLAEAQQGQPAQQAQQARRHARPRPDRRKKVPYVDIRKFKFTMPTGIFEQMKARMELDDSQKQTLEQIAQEYDEKMTQLRQEYVERCKDQLNEEQLKEMSRILRYDRYKQNPPRGVAMIKGNPRLFRILGRMWKFDDQLKQNIEIILKQYEAGLENIPEEDETARKQYSEQVYNQIMLLLTPEQQLKVKNFQRRNEKGQRGAAGRAFGQQR